MLIKQIGCDTSKAHIARDILEVLPDWFGIPAATEEYIVNSKSRPFFCAYDGDTPIGFLLFKSKLFRWADMIFMMIQPHLSIAEVQGT